MIDVASWSPSRVLVVDDDEFSLQWAVVCLNQLGIDHVDTLLDSGLAQLHTLCISYELLICDLCMPEVDGVEVLRQLADAGFEGAVILSSGVEERVIQLAEQAARSRGLRILGHLAKPFTVDQLKTLLQSVGRAELKPNAPSQGTIAREELERGMRGAEFTVLWQPQVTLKERRLVGVEMLARWHCLGQDWIPPALFIPASEQEGIAFELTAHLLDVGLEHAAKCFQFCELSLSINVSAQCLSSGRFVGLLRALSKKHGIAVSRLMIEVTESCVVDDLLHAMESLAQLRLLGARLSIDDFGTGYSSLEQLRRFPFSELKVDRGFTAAALDDATALTIMQSAADLARKLGLQTVVEGIETEAEWQMAQHIGFDLAQGYLVARPMAAADLSVWQAAWQASSTGRSHPPSE